MMNHMGIKMEFETETTCLFSLQDYKGEIVTLVGLNPYCIEFERKNETTIIRTPIVFIDKAYPVGAKVQMFRFDMVNDPTPFIAGGTVSLGYYSLRLSLVNCKILSTHPLVVESKERHLLKFVRPMRRTT